MRRLQHLQEKKAYFGMNTDPDILMEIEDIEMLLDSEETDSKNLTNQLLFTNFPHLCQLQFTLIKKSHEFTTVNYCLLR